MFMKKINDRYIIIILAIAVVIKQIAWMITVPLWHYPDEQAHYGQINYTYTVHEFIPNKNLSQEILTTERILQTERDWAGNNRFTYHPEYIIPYTQGDVGRHEEEIKNLSRESRVIMTINESTSYPPLYYSILGQFFKLFSSLDILWIVFILRFVNIIFSVFIVIISYKTFKIVFESTLAAFSSTVLVIFQPMFSFVSAGINSDNIYNLLFAAGLYSGALIIKKGISIRQILYSLIVIFLTIKTKIQGYLLVPVLFSSVGIEILNRKEGKKNLFYILLILFIFLMLFPNINLRLLLPEVYTNPTTSISVKDYMYTTMVHMYREVLPWYWGVFRWLSLSLPRVANQIVNRLLAFFALGIIIYCVKKIWKRGNLPLARYFVYFFLANVIYFGGVIIFNYYFFITHGFSFGIQGRYFFPLLVAQMGLITYGAYGWGINKKIPSLIMVVSAIGMIILHEIAFIRVLSSYFDTVSLPLFFLQMSQYKPIFFKSPVVQYIITAQVISILYIIRELIISARHNNETS